MQRLAEVIFAQGLWGIRLSHVEDLPIAIAPAYNKPTAAVNGFFSLCYTIAYFMPLFPTHQFQTYIVFPVSIIQENLPSQISAFKWAQRQTLNIYDFVPHFCKQEKTVTPSKVTLKRAVQTDCTMKCLLCRFDQMCNIQILLSGILYPTMQCAWPNLLFPVWWMNWK